MHSGPCGKAAPEFLKKSWAKGVFESPLQGNI
jgi:hypothetical protein